MLLKTLLNVFVFWQLQSEKSLNFSHIFMVSSFRSLRQMFEIETNKN